MIAAIEVALSEVGGGEYGDSWGMSMSMDADHSNHDNLNQWADKARSWVQFGYDVDTKCERWWAAHRQRTVGVVVRM